MAIKKSRRGGRPKVRARDRKDKILYVRLSRRDYLALEACAEGQRLAVSSWARLKLLEAAR